MQHNAIDAHFHADILMSQEPEFVPTYKTLGLSGLSWSYAHNIGSWRDYPVYWRHLAEVCVELTSRGLPCAYLVGIHPRCIPDDLVRQSDVPAELEQEILRHLQQPNCRGMGELGLETGAAKEINILRRQLETAAQGLPEGKKVGIHTPRRNKLQVSRLILQVLRSSPARRESLLVDHLDSSVLPLVRDEGYMLGMTLQPGKSDLNEVQSILDSDPDMENRLIVNSDGAKEMSKPFLEAIQEGMARASRTWHKVLFSNARDFWGLFSAASGRSRPV